MGIMDDVKDKMGGDSDGMRDRYEQLKSQAQNEGLDDKGREEYEQLRNHFEQRDTE